VQLERPVLRVPHGRPGRKSLLEGLEKRADEAERRRVPLLLVRRRLDDLGEHRAGGEHARLRLHGGEGAHQLEGFDPVQLTARSLDPARRDARHRVDGTAETPPALARRRRHAAHPAMLFGQEGHDEIRLAELGRAQHVGFVTALLHEPRMIADRIGANVHPSGKELRVESARARSAAARGA